MIDKLERVIAYLIALHKVSVNLLLIGGFRYRLLDNSQRFSVDIDYHWDGDLTAKQEELLELFQSSILKQIENEFVYEGRASLRTGPDADSPNARFVDLRFWNRNHALEIPIEITKIALLDPQIIRTTGGAVHPTASEADLIESKIIAILNRVFIQHRDFIDLFLYSDRLHTNALERLEKKLEQLSIGKNAIARRITDLEQYPDYHSRSVQKVVDEQMTSTMARQINAGGGGAAILASAIQTLKKTLRL